MLSRCQVTHSTPSISPSYPANSTKQSPTHTPAHLPSNIDTPTHRHPAQHRGEQSQSRSGRDPISYRSVYQSSIYPLSCPLLISQSLSHLLSLQPSFPRENPYLPVNLPIYLSSTSYPLLSTIKPCNNMTKTGQTPPNPVRWYRYQDCHPVTRSPVTEIGQEGQLRDQPVRGAGHEPSTS